MLIELRMEESFFILPLLLLVLQPQRRFLPLSWSFSACFGAAGHSDPRD